MAHSENALGGYLRHCLLVVTGNRLSDRLESVPFPPLLNYLICHLEYTKRQNPGGHLCLLTIKDFNYLSFQNKETIDVEYIDFVVLNNERWLKI